jgi:hypothetical protein
MLTREEVVWGFKYCLGRNPGGEDVIDQHMKMADYKTLREHLLKSPEFLSRMTTHVKPAEDHPFANYGRRAVVFIHVQKTAGTSVTQALAANFDSPRRCPERFNQLHHYSLAELGKYDFFSGHFDLFSTHLIPRRGIFRLSFFRKPSDRLISFYRFARAHPPSPSLLADPHFALAKELDAVAYFSHDWIRASRLINNHYRAVFGGSLWPGVRLNFDGGPSGDTVFGNVDRAIEGVRGLDGLGLTHRFTESMQMIFHDLSFSLPNAPKKLMSTDQMALEDDEATHVPPIPMTPDLQGALDALVKDDDRIFEVAEAEFARRFEAGNGPAALGNGPGASELPPNDQADEIRS